MPDYPTTPSARDGKRQPKTPGGQGREAKARRRRDAKRRKAPEGLGRRSRLCSVSPVPSARAQGPGNRASPRQDPGHARMQARNKENTPSIRPTWRRLARRPPANKGEGPQRHAEEGAAQGQSQPGGESANAAGLPGLTAPSGAAGLLGLTAPPSGAAGLLGLTAFSGATGATLGQALAGRLAAGLGDGASPGTPAGYPSAAPRSARRSRVARAGRAARRGCFT